MSGILSEEQKLIILGALRRGHGINTACTLAGVARDKDSGYRETLWTAGVLEALDHTRNILGREQSHSIFWQTLGVILADMWGLDLPG